MMKNVSCILIFAELHNDIDVRPNHMLNSILNAKKIMVVVCRCKCAAMHTLFFKIGEIINEEKYCIQFDTVIKKLLVMGLTIANISTEMKFYCFITTL